MRLATTIISVVCALRGAGGISLLRSAGDDSSNVDYRLAKDGEYYDDEYLSRNNDFVAANSKGEIIGWMRFDIATIPESSRENTLRLLGIKCLFSPLASKRDAIVYISDVQVKKELRGKKIGKNLVKHGMQYIHNRWPEAVAAQLWVANDNNAARKTYEGFGFEAIGGMPVAARAGAVASELDYRPARDGERYYNEILSAENFFVAANSTGEILGRIKIYRYVRSPKNPFTSPEEDDRNEMAFFWSVKVKPEQQGKGIGKSMVINCLEYIHSHWPNVALAELQVASNNVIARKVYEAAGFEVVKEKSYIWTPYGAMTMLLGTENDLCPTYRYIFYPDTQS
ncbi:hypothetical protein FOL47_004093 [Perkinsus chesapeaki]|uniref:N-acetyltransferase domain-containing protein n=1 Tax=Perkinsus chesapeaki TaxID=330153 RepID=A0A7J6M4N2_PERCH|nr:hypothetical protein FOL47_004093 [Perkinsus chesapeaki]